MATRSEAPEVPCRAVVQSAVEQSKKVIVKDLIELSVRGLGPMYDAEKRLFCYSRVQRDGRLKQEGLSPRYTIMTLLGLIELEKAGGKSPFDIDAILAGLLANQSWPDSAGDFGLLAWLTAIRAPENLPSLFARFYVPSALEKYQDTRHGCTMQMAWLLTGLSYLVLAGQGNIPGVEDLARETYEALIENQGNEGFFGHLHCGKTAVGQLRGWVGSFADQVYPILALTRYSQAFDSSDALDRASLTARGICRVQGPLGQWWWHYDSREGRIASMYPVFSVHQEAMGPMALFPLGEATGQDFTQNIYRGLEWISDANETGKDMRNFSENLVWRNVHPLFEFSMKIDVIMSHLRIYRDASKRRMGVLYECRPYELGWLLYAFSSRQDL